ncbi:MAG: hypothetical protein WC666_01825 [Candidatus Paceibacterota bacterium]|jgi:hypothetical protein
MKKTLWAVFLIALLLLIFAPSINGETLTNQLADKLAKEKLLIASNEFKSTLPERLPIGSLQEVIDWNITNATMERTVAVSLIYTNSYDHLEYWVTSYTYGSNYLNYDKFIDSVVKEAMSVYSDIKNSEDIGSDIILKVCIWFEKQDINYYGLTFNSNLGQVDQISENVIKSAKRLFSIAENEIIIPVKGLERFEIQADTAPGELYRLWVWTEDVFIELNPLPSPYSFVWNNGVYSQSRNIQIDYPEKDKDRWHFYKETTTTNLIDLNDWCLCATNRIRFTITAQGETKVYTQHGDVLKQASLTISPNNLDINLPRGADVIIESSTDLVNWSVFKTIPWSSGIDHTSFFVDTTIRHSFYRTKVW